MTSQSRLETVTDDNWQDFVNSEQSVLLVTTKDCPHCKKWSEQLSEYIENTLEWSEVRFGKVVLDSDHVEDFKNSNEWLEMIDGVPFTVFYLGGEPKISFHGSGIKRLVNRLNRLRSD